jgi:outer membrane assembly lipoprotein YfiO
LFARGVPVQFRAMGIAKGWWVVGVLLVAPMIARAEPKTWEYAGGGQWPQVNAPTTQSATPDPTLDRVEQLIRANQNRSAAKLGIQWLLSHRNDPQHERGLFLVAQAWYQYGDRVRAFYYLDELMDEHPDSRLYGPALEKQYAIADSFLNGYKRRFLGMPAFHAYDEAVEMLYRIQQRSPGSQLAEKSLLRTANYYFNDQQYDFAADTYGAFMRTYPRSPQTQRVKLRYAYSLYAQFRGPQFDATPVIDAREQLREAMAQYPQLSAEEKLPDLVTQLDRNLARKLYWTADFYRRTKEPRGAAYTYRYLAKAYPQTPEGQKAPAAMAKLPEWALATAPEPAITPGFAPPTPPLEPPRLAPQPRIAR